MGSFIDDIDFDEDILGNGPDSAKTDHAKATEILNKGKKLGIIEAIDNLIRLSHDSGLDDEFFARVKICTDVVGKVYGLTPMQCVLFAVSLEMNNRGREIDTEIIGKWCYSKESSTFGTMRLAKDLEMIRSKGLIAYCVNKGPAEYFVPNAVVKAVCEEKPYIDDKDEDITLWQFLALLSRTLPVPHSDMSLNKINDNLDTLLSENKHLAFVRKVRSYKLSDTDRLLLLSCCMDKISGSSPLIFQEICSIFGLRESRRIWNSLIDGTNVLIQKGILIGESYSPEMVSFKISPSAREELLSELDIHEDRGIARQETNLIQCSTLQEKEMFYNVRESEQIDLLREALGIERLKAIQGGLEAKRQRKGFTCLFYGAPGTGKTETVYQIAQKTGRDIMSVDISSIRDKYVGESEKNIQAVFDSYRKICEKSVVMPILLFNEADGILSRRMENVQQEADQMNNAMQNIVLQEMERFEGILIATTNLFGNLDHAFERRFLYKVEFEKPTLEARVSIWKSMIPALNESQASELALAYDFSGGQIENIARKQTIESLMLGNSSEIVNMKAVFKACDREKITNKKNAKTIMKIGY
jgi:hypothetical protein